MMKATITSAAVTRIASCTCARPRICTSVASTSVSGGSSMRIDHAVARQRLPRGEHQREQQQADGDELEAGHVVSPFPLPAKRGEGARTEGPSRVRGSTASSLRAPHPPRFARHPLPASRGEGQKPHTIVGTGLNVVEIDVLHRREIGHADHARHVEREVHPVLLHRAVLRQLEDVAVELGLGDVVRDLVDLGDQLDRVGAVLRSCRKASPP